VGKITHKDAADMATAHRVSESEWKANTTHLDSQGNTLELSRSATLVVAGNDAPDKCKAGADYVCDGVDDQVELQAAIDALPANGGKVVFFGSLELTDEVAIEKNRVWLSGAGPGSCLNLNTDNKNGIRLGIANASAVQEVHLTDFRIVGNGGDLDNGRIGLQVLNAIRCYFDKLGIFSCGGWGIDVQYNHSLFFSHITLMGNGRTKATTGNLKIGTDSQPVNILSFVDSAVETGGTGIKINQASMPIIQNCTIESNRYYGIHVNQTVGRSLSLKNLYLENNNAADSADAKDIFIERANNTSILDNIIIDSREATAYSLYVGTADYIRIQGGYCDKAVAIGATVSYVEGSYDEHMEKATRYPWGNRAVTRLNLYPTLSAGVSVFWGLTSFIPFLEGSGTYLGDISGKNAYFYTLGGTKTWGTVAATGRTACISVTVGWRSASNWSLDGDRTFVVVALPGWANTYDQDKYWFDWRFDADNRISLYTANVAGSSATKFVVKGAGTEQTASNIYAYDGGAPLVIICTIKASTGEVILYINGTARDSNTGAGTVVSDAAIVYLNGDYAGANINNNTKWVTYAVYSRCMGANEITRVTKELAAVIGLDM